MTLPYLEEFPGGPRRPYLWLDLRGPNGQSGPVFGLVDTGADVSVLPSGYASLMGYGPSDLDTEQIHGVGGDVDAFRPKVPATANVLGIENYTFDMSPMFLSGSDVLWGRADFMKHFSVLVEEDALELSLLLPSGALLDSSD